MQKLRAVEIDAVLDTNNLKSVIRTSPKKAWFHQWASIVKDGKEITIGIVEDVTGRIHRVPPESVKFDQPIFKEVNIK